ncbi:MAG: hypothetical protein ACFE0Q_00680 [Anaerolineae bacterium]
MYVDLWAWFRQYELQALLRQDLRRRRLVTLARDGWRQRELADADQAIRCFEEGASLATELNEPCWVIFHQYWVAEMLFYLKHDYQGTLDYIVRLTAESRKPIYQDCPVLSRVFFVLANIYYMIDFYRYEEQIVELLDHIEQQVMMDEDTHLRVLHMRAQIEYEHERYAQALDITQDMLNRSQDNDFRQRSGYHMLRAVTYAQGDVAQALDYAHIAEQHAHVIQVQRSIAEGRLWMAVYQQRLGLIDNARASYQSALDYYQRYRLPREVTYHDASAEYHELLGDIQTALTLRLTLIEQTAGNISLYNQMSAHWQYCRLLGRLGHALDEALADARALSTQMSKPQAYLHKIKAIENGAYWEFDWQKPDST